MRRHLPNDSLQQEAQPHAVPQSKPLTEQHLVVVKVGHYCMLSLFSQLLTGPGCSNEVLCQLSLGFSHMEQTSSKCTRASTFSNKNLASATEESKSLLESSSEASPTPAPQDVAPRANPTPSRRGSTVVPPIATEAVAQAAAQQSDKASESLVTPAAAVAEVDDDEEKALNVPENSPFEIFLYSGYELTTSKRKRMQVDIHP